MARNAHHTSHITAPVLEFVELGCQMVEVRTEFGKPTDARPSSGERGGHSGSTGMVLHVVVFGRRVWGGGGRCTATATATAATVAVAGAGALMRIHDVILTCGRLLCGLTGVGMLLRARSSIRARLLLLLLLLLLHSLPDSVLVLLQASVLHHR